MTRQEKTVFKRLRDYEANALRGIRRVFVEPETHTKSHEDCTACYIQSEHNEKMAEKALAKRFGWSLLALVIICLVTIFLSVKCAHASIVSGVIGGVVASTLNNTNNPDAIDSNPCFIVLPSYSASIAVDVKRIIAMNTFGSDTYIHLTGGIEFHTKLLPMEIVNIINKSCYGKEKCQNTTCPNQKKNSSNGLDNGTGSEARQLQD